MINEIYTANEQLTEVTYRANDKNIWYTISIAKKKSVHWWTFHNGLTPESNNVSCKHALFTVAINAIPKEL